MNIPSIYYSNHIFKSFLKKAQFILELIFLILKIHFK